MLVSIVITNFNYADFVSAAIDGALAQRGVETEVIVVDDGSTDGSRTEIERYADRVTALYTTNGGQGAAFNRGFAASSGQVVLFLDADDVLWAGTGRRVVDLMGANPSVVRVQYALDVIDASGARTGERIPAAGRTLFQGDARPRLLTCPDDIVWQPTSGNAFRRDVLTHILPMPQEPYRLCADYYLSSLVPLHGGVAVLEGTGGGYRVHGGNRHYSRSEQPARLRANVRRTHDTHACLIAEARRLGLGGLPLDPGSVLSVSAAANRVVSYRIDRRRHPLPADSRTRLTVLGVRSCVLRSDLARWRRGLYAVWFVAMAVAPRRLIPLVARPFVQIEQGTARHGADPADHAGRS